MGEVPLTYQQLMIDAPIPKRLPQASFLPLLTIPRIRGRIPNQQQAFGRGARMYTADNSGERAIIETGRAEW